MLCASSAAAQTNNLDLGTVLASGKVIWVRATATGAVEFFISQGYRDALARPSLVAASRLAHWTDSAQALQAPAAGIAEAKSAADTGLAFDRWVGTDSSGLEIKRDGQTVLRVSDTPARELIDLLARGANLTQRLSAPARPVTAVAKDTVRPPTPQPAPVPAPAATITIEQVAVAAPSPQPVESAAVVNVVEPAPVATTTSAAAQNAAPPAPPRTDSAPPTPVRAPTLEASIDANIPRDAAHRASDLEARHGPVVVAQVKAQELPPATFLDKHVQTPLGPFVVPAAKLVNHDTEIRYCYTELGLRYDRHLTGDVTVRVNVSDAGFADTVEVTKRTWDGVAAAEVESCMRALIEDWTFDDRQPSDSKTVELHFTLTPAMRTAATDGAAQQSAQPR